MRTIWVMLAQAESMPALIDLSVRLRCHARGTPGTPQVRGPRQQRRTAAAAAALVAARGLALPPDVLFKLGLGKPVTGDDLGSRVDSDQYHGHGQTGTCSDAAHGGGCSSMVDAGTAVTGWGHLGRRGSASQQHPGNGRWQVCGGPARVPFGTSNGAAQPTALMGEAFEEQEDEDEHVHGEGEDLWGIEELVGAEGVLEGRSSAAAGAGAERGHEASHSRSSAISRLSKENASSARPFGAAAAVCPSPSDARVRGTASHLGDSPGLEMSHVRGTLAHGCASSAPNTMPGLLCSHCRCVLSAHGYGQYSQGSGLLAASPTPQHRCKGFNKGG
jgi:hypothetical protein